MTPTRPQSPLPRQAWLDCSAGIAGDMLLGALLDAGASLEVVRRAVAAVDPALDVRLERTQRHQLDCAKATVLDTTTGQAADAPHAPHHGPDHHGPDHHGPDHHGPDHHGHDHHHRSWHAVRHLLDDADLDPGVRTRAHAAFAALAKAEGAVHGMDPEQVTFHEVGALDAIGDIVGCAAALSDLDIERLTASAVTVGHGEQVLGSHGRIPIPGPAVTHLVRAAQIPVTGGPVALEMTTPTGAAMLAAWCHGFGALPTLVVDRVGLGAGTRDPERLANVARVIVGTPVAVGAAGPDPDTGTGNGTATEDAIVLETNVDDLDPRLWPEAIEALLAAGAHDAWLTPILMKKGRPAHTLSVLCSPVDRPHILAAIAAHTTTLGVRERPVTKHVFARRVDTIDIDGHRIDVKVALYAGEVSGAQPEFDDCRAAAAALGISTKEVIARAVTTWRGR